MLLPDPVRRGDIHFHLAKSLPYDTRLGLIFVLLTAGFVVQALALTYASGWAVTAGVLCLFAATLLALVKGYTNRPRAMKGTREWRGAEREHLARIVSISAKSKTWDQSVLDITCARGSLTLVGALVAAGAGAILLDSLGYEQLAAVWLLDAGVLILPHWITGVRKVLTNDPLTIKARLLAQIMDRWQAAAQPDEQMLPQMEVLTTAEGQLPQDAKLVLQMNRLGADFLGLQTQVVVNNVQGSDYPYLYCVLVARPRLGLHKQLRPEPPPKIVAEAKTQDDVDILIIRQHTTKTSGYHTDTAAGLRIFEYALGQARKLRPAAAG
jgi:hypothetical protein